MNWRQYLCEWLGCGDCSQEEEALRACLAQNDQMEETIWNLKDKIRQLELLVPGPPPPQLGTIYERDTVWVQNTLASLGLAIIRLPLDARYFLCSQSDFLNIVAWDWVDSIKYVPERFDCDKFAVAFKAHVNMYFHINNVGLVIDYRGGHAYNLVIFPDGKIMLVEPQNDNVFCWTKRPEKLYPLQGATVLL